MSALLENHLRAPGSGRQTCRQPRPNLRSVAAALSRKSVLLPNNWPAQSRSVAPRSNNAALLDNNGPPQNNNAALLSNNDPARSSAMGVQSNNAPMLLRILPMPDRTGAMQDRALPLQSSKPAKWRNNPAAHEGNTSVSALLPLSPTQLTENERKTSCHTQKQ